MPDNPNPQGKGQVPVLQHWETSRPALVQAKDERTLLNDYAVSVLILSAQFKFKPVVGNTYYLYFAKAVWRLSLIAPGEWTGDGLGTFVGSCCLRTDMTWEMNPSHNIEANQELVAALRSFITGFAGALDTHETLEAGLPYYVTQLPFYQRLLATGLASSLKRSARLAGLADRSAHSWLIAGGADHFRLLPATPVESH